MFCLLYTYIFVFMEEIAYDIELRVALYLTWSIFLTIRLECLLEGMSKQWSDFISPYSTQNMYTQSSEFFRSIYYPVYLLLRDTE